ncbi:iron complex transport system ATP-binding protein [Desulfosarcina sp. BuS5]|uniref:ABC transporter ATP-binding protein n=1 Tax=Desulfosarcina sp. BuS5 TaxID=933262 RepID=UPI0004837902|nr:ABC transporter ATP-binding protein [Desulfosarcina sp. BuS5]WDN88738.1 iron complex transport system ATP-binding protein [Desulfosarcina sp. BuS5]
MKNSAPVLDIQNLSVGYKNIPVLNSVNLSFGKGIFISLLGPNGAGKTTLLKTLAGLLAPVRGRVLVNGKDIADFKRTELAGIIAVVLTEKVSPGLFSVVEFVAQGRYPHTDFFGRLQKKDLDVVSSALEMVNAADLADRQLGSLSDGERQKTYLARALAQEPEVIILDEPTMHLDLKHRMDVMSILRRMCQKKGITIIASLHDVDIASKISDCVALVKNGAVTGWGPPEKMLSGNAVADLYDFDDADFNPALGSIEIRGNGRRGKVFVAAGMGTGAVLYRLLAKKGFRIATGVLHTNDLDYYVAGSLGAECVVQAPMEPVSEDQFNMAAALVKQADFIIDTGFAAGDLNQRNIELFKYALVQSKRVITMRRQSNGLFEGFNCEELIKCFGETEILEKMELLL